MLFLAGLSVVATAARGADEKPVPSGPVSFYRQVRPVLQRNCTGCHQPAKAGGKLLLNLDTGALGELRVGLLDAAGKPLAGFSADDCVPLQINSFGAVVRWKGGDLASLRDQGVRLEFRSRRTKLYSFRLE